MEKFLLDTVQLIIAVRVSYSLLKWIFFAKKKGQKSISKKVWKLCTNRIHHLLDNALRNQKKKIYSTKQKDIVYPSNVVPLRKTK